MHSHGEASVPSHEFVHQAMIYGSDEEFMDVALPFVEEGLDTKEPTLVAVDDRHIENLRAALGGTPDGLTIHPVADWYETSARTREKFASWASERSAGGCGARLMGEPPWPVGNEARVRDWARHEAVINVAFASLPVTCMCPYDATALPEEVLGHARATHPEIVRGGRSSPSDSYVNPLDFCGRLDSTVQAQRRPPSMELQYELEDLPAVRRLIGSFALDAGMTGSRTEEIVLAANEIATNAVIHGRPPTTLRAWRSDGEIIVDVTDAGDGIRDALAGQLPPPADSLGGRGLWLTRLLCEAVEVCNAGGCTVTMRATATSGDRPLTTA
ncbi:MAG TPA: sensor histidine kinase [Solirubrobacterales bacterium]|nr:sensor histidine kinase [Solirubrobacterales bacterium]